LRWFLRPEWVIVWITLLYTIITGLTLLAIKRQADLMEQQTKDARDSAAAAALTTKATLKAIKRQALSMRRQTTHLRRSAEAAMGVAVPTLMLSKFVFTPRDRMDYQFFVHPSVSIEVKNFGQSPAFLKSYSIVFACEELPKVPIYRFPYPCCVEDVVEAGQTYTLAPDTTIAEEEFPLQIAYDLESGRKRLTVYGYVSYGDVFGSPLRHMKFSKRLSSFSHAERVMTLWDYGGYEYTGYHENTQAPDQQCPQDKLGPHSCE
jgi:hypothetical protein